MTNQLLEFLTRQGLDSTTSEYVASTVILILILLVSILAYGISKNIFLKLLKVIFSKTKLKSADLLIEHKVLQQLVMIVPAFVTYSLSSMLIHGQVWVKRISFSFLVYIFLRSFDKFLGFLDDIYRKTEASKTRPIKGLLQIIKIISYALGGIIIISVLMDRSPVLLLGGIGAASAVLMLIFQNTILGFVASIQLTENDMVRIGDWIEMPSHNANGDVIEISLHTVKVVNWDKTVTTIPTYAMISESFKNWRNMQQTGGRRIKRAFYIDMTSVQFCDQQMLERYQKVQYIKQYLVDKTNEIQEYNEKNQIDYSSLINGRRLTNLGTFRAYLNEYLMNHPKVHKELTMLVRHLEPTEHGLPIELYLFTNTTKWAEYESIQADIFDHILSIVPEFDLRIFQSPTGNDFSHVRL